MPRLIVTMFLEICLHGSPPYSCHQVYLLMESPPSRLALGWEKSVFQRLFLQPSPFSMGHDCPKLGIWAFSGLIEFTMVRKSITNTEQHLLNILSVVDFIIKTFEDSIGDQLWFCPWHPWAGNHWDPLWLALQILELVPVRMTSMSDTMWCDTKVDSLIHHGSGGSVTLCFIKPKKVSNFSSVWASA